MKRRAPALLALVGSLLVVGLVSWLLWVDPTGAGVQGPRDDSTAATSGASAADLRGARSRDRSLLGDGPEGEVHALPLVAAEQFFDEPTVPVRTLRLRGRVVDGGGEPVPGAEVFFLPSRDERIRRGLPAYYFREPVPWESFARTMTGADGRFELAAEEVARPSGHRPLNRTGSFAVENSMLALVRDDFATRLIELPEGGWDLGLGDVVMTPAATVIGRVVAPDAEPIAGARMTPVKQSSSPGGWWSTQEPLVSVLTDSSGRFELKRLPAGEYQLHAGAPSRRLGFADVTAVAGERVDAGSLVLARGTRLAGRVLDHELRPVAGAALTLRTAAPDDVLDTLEGDTALVDSNLLVSTRPGSYERQLQTDADGHFRLDGLDPVPHDLWVRAEGHEAVHVRALAAGREDVEVVLGPEPLIVIQLLDAETQEAVLGASVGVSRQRFANGEPLFDRAIPAVAGEQAVERLASRSEAGEILQGVGAGGEGVFVAGPAGFIANRMSVSAPGYLGITRGLPGVEPGGLHRDTVMLEAITSLATIHGRTTDAEGAPVAHVELSATTSVRGVPAGNAISDVDGRFTLEGLAAGTWRLRAGHAEYLTHWKHGLTLAPDQVLEDVVLELDSGGRISGRVTAVDGSPMALHTVELRELGDGNRFMVKRSNLTDGEGRFRFPALEPDTYLVCAPPGAPVHVELLTGQELEVVLQVRQAVRLWGQVRDARGQPLATGVTLFAEHPDGRRETFETKADEQGHWRLDDLPAVRGQLVAFQWEVHTPPIDVVLDWGDEAEHDLVFDAGRLVGRVLQVGTEEPAAGARIYASAQHDRSDGPGPWRLLARATSDAGGHFELSDLPPATYGLRVLRGDWVATTPETFDVTLSEDLVAAGGAVTHDLWVEAGASLEGRLTVIDPALGPTDRYPKLTLRLERLDSPEKVRLVRLSGKTEYSVTGLRGGRWRYTVGKRVYRWETVVAGEAYLDGELSIPPGEAVQLNLVVTLP